MKLIPHRDHCRHGILARPVLIGLSCLAFSLASNAAEASGEQVPHEFETYILEDVQVVDAMSISAQAQAVGRYRSTQDSPNSKSFSFFGGELEPWNYLGATETFVGAISPGGSIVGSYLNRNFEETVWVTQGFIDRDGLVETFDLPDPHYIRPHTINDNGQVAGVYYTLGVGQGGLVKTQRHFIYSKAGGAVTLDIPGAVNVQETQYPYLDSINAQGTVAGTIFTQDSNPETAGLITRGFLYAGGKVSFIDVPGARDTVVAGINNQGDVVGHYTTETDGTTQRHGFIYRAGQFTALDFPDALATEATGVNDRGQVVGYYTGGTPAVNHGFVYYAGQFNPVDVPEAESTEPKSINAGGQFAGSYFLPAVDDFRPAGVFVATPLPRPIPAIRVNGSDLPVTVKAGAPLTITVELFGEEGTDADWWVVAQSDSNDFYYYHHPGEWFAIGQDLMIAAPAYQGPLFELAPLELLNIPALNPGHYTLYFGVDTVMNGQLDFDSVLHYDTVEVTVE